MHPTSISKHGLVSGLFVAAIVSSLWAADHKADNPAAIRSAFANAAPGDTITIPAGVYEMGNDLATGKDGTKQQPIEVRCGSPKGYAELRANGQVAFRVKNSFWIFRNIHFQGNPSRTAAVLFLDGPKNCNDLLVSQCKISGSQEHGVKSAKQGRDKPVHRVTFERTELYDTGATGFDFVCGDDWVMRNCYVHDYGKGGGVSYGIFMKGGGKNGLIEGCLVDGKKIGATVGISFGGGLTGQQWLPQLADGSLGPEHENGVARNNIVINTADAAYHANKVRNCSYYNNLAWNCGAGFQHQKIYSEDAKTYPLLTNNLLKPGSKLNPNSANNVIPNESWFVNAAAGDFRLSVEGKTQVSKGQQLAANPVDFFLTKRGVTPILGPVLPDARRSTAWSNPQEW